MRRVFIIAPSFAPVSNPPTLRVRSFVRHLDDFGWTPTVVAARQDRYEDAADPDINVLVPAALRVLRSDAYRAGVTRLVGIGDIGLRAYRPMRRLLRGLCEADPPDAVLIPGPPWYTFRLGPWLTRRFGIPYVLDYIDPWVTQPTGAAWWRKARWHQRVARLLEPEAIRRAAHIIGVSQGTIDGVRARYPDLRPDAVTAIPYGFEASDFAAAVTRGARAGTYEPWAAGDGCWHAVAVGAVLPRGHATMRALFAAVAAVRREHPALGARLRIHFVGTTYDPRAPRPLVRPLAEAMGVGNAVTEHPARVPYLDALALLRRSDAILVLGSTEPHYMPSKIFPTIAARRPYLALLHASSPACDVVRAAAAAGDRYGALVTYDEMMRAPAREGAVAAALVDLMTRTPAALADTIPAALAPYSARAMTGRLAAVLDGVTRGSGPAHG